MPRFVKISTLCPTQYIIDPKLDYNSAVDKMINHWRNEFAQVIPDKPDLIVTPEICDLPPGYSLDMELEYYRIRGNRVRDFMQEIAAQNKCYIAYSAVRETLDGTWRNSTQIIDRSGNIIGVYDKNHLVIEENTKAGFLYGKDSPIIECDFGTIGCAICFDLNFDELRLKYVAARPDLIIFSSIYHGGLMQNYWAYSCRAHFVGSVAGLPSSIISPVGQTIASTTNYFKHATAQVNLDSEVIHLGYNWDKIKAAKERYGSKFIMSDPAHLGAVLISNESEGITIKDIIKEFDIELLDEYFTRALAHRRHNLV